jgi:hypothetical protein
MVCMTPRWQREPFGLPGNVSDSTQDSADSLERLVPALFEALHRRYPTVDPGILWDAAVETLFRPGDASSSENGPTTREPPWRVLRIARRHVATRLRSEARRRRREAAITSPHAGASPLGALLRAERIRVARAAFHAARRRLGNTAQERVLLLMLQGEKRQHVFAHVLDIDHLAVDEQRLLIKRSKDAVRQTLKRAWKACSKSGEPGGARTSQCARRPKG